LYHPIGVDIKKDFSIVQITSVKDFLKANYSKMNKLIENAIRVCDFMIDPSSPNIPKSLLSNCAGVAIFHSVEAGAIISASVANGILLRRDQESGEWSPPSALCMADVGVGGVLGAEKSDIIMVMVGDDVVHEMSAMAQLKLGLNLSIVAGPLTKKGEGYDREAAFHLSPRGTGVTYCYAHSAGTFIAHEVTAGVLLERGYVNAEFYNSAAKPIDILFKKGSVEIPEESRVPELHKKLEMIVKGESSVPQ
jgi:lipid-binding SYLF domain-containing protein